LSAADMKPPVQLNCAAQKAHRVLIEHNLQFHLEGAASVGIEKIRQPVSVSRIAVPKKPR